MFIPFGRQGFKVALETFAATKFNSDHEENLGLRLLDIFDGFLGNGAKYATELLHLEVSFRPQI
jgi:hypothetical protein